MLPEGVTIEDVAPEEVVAKVIAPVAEEEEVEKGDEEAAEGEPQVITKGKEEEEKKD